MVGGWVGGDAGVVDEDFLGEALSVRAVVFSWSYFMVWLTVESSIFRCDGFETGFDAVVAGYV